MTKLLQGLFLLLSLSGCAWASEQPLALLQNRVILLVADDWCPQHCEHQSEYRGYIVELVAAALSAEQAPYRIDYLPWLRALKAVERGEFDGLLTPTVNGYPQFLFHHEAVGYQDYCFYTRQDSTWQYRQFSDLLGKKLAFLQDSGFGELEGYLAQHREQIETQQFSGGQGFTRKLFDFLERGRADSIIMTSDVYQFSLKTGAIADRFRPAGCLGHEKLAVGLSPADPQRAQAIARLLDSGIRKLRERGELQSILARYGLEPWDASPKQETGH